MSADLNIDKLHASDRMVIIRFSDHDTPAYMHPHEDGYYAYSNHFGMMLFDDQHRSHPNFDPGSPISWGVPA